jgi:6-phosphogluconate dehydrogenase
VMGQNYALNVASKGFTISVHNRSPGRVDTTVARAAKEGLSEKVFGFKDAAEFVASLQKPRRVMFLVTAGAVVDKTIAMFAELMEEGDIIIDGGNEWFENSVRRAAELKPKGIHFVAMGISGGEEGARNGPSIMPGCPRAAYDALEEILVATAATDGDGGKCVTWLGEIGSGNYVKMVHNGIEYGDMQLISESYDILRTVGGFSNEELAGVFEEWNSAELDSFLIEITAKILAKKDDQCLDWSDSTMVPPQGVDMVDLILDATANKGTGKMTVKEAATRGVAAPTIAAALDARFISFTKEERVAAEPILGGLSIPPITNKEQLKTDVKNALYCSKICSYAQGMNIIRAASEEFGWNVNLSESARIWKGGCIIRAKFLDIIKEAYAENPALASLLVHPAFAEELKSRAESWRRIVTLGVCSGIATPSMSASLAYFDQYRRARLTANLVQAQRDFFGSHTFERTDKPRGEKFHCIWTEDHIAETGH